ncbi:hypothetical protein SLA2020_270400 [Shorea laevis]
MKSCQRLMYVLQIGNGPTDQISVLRSHYYLFVQGPSYGHGFSMHKRYHLPYVAVKSTTLNSTSQILHLNPATFGTRQILHHTPATFDILLRSH